MTTAESTAPETRHAALAADISRVRDEYADEKAETAADARRQPVPADQPRP
jgi:hypothetical protein